jgi:hypothetical protein
MSFELAHIGLTTTVLESVATSIGAGMLISGFVMAAIGLALGWSRRDIEARALRDATAGGLLACGLLIFDLWMRYVV